MRASVHAPRVVSFLWALSALSGVASCEISETQEVPAAGATTSTSVPISGGTLAAGRSGPLSFAVVADSERDRIQIVDLDAAKVLHTIALQDGDEPGRVIVDGDLAHVLLRRGGAVVTISASQGSMVGRRAVCPAPRGIALDANAGVFHVACQGGELVTFASGSASGEPVRRVRIERDLRDVVVSQGSVWVTTFRHANLLAIDPDGSVGARYELPADGFLDVTLMPAGTTVEAEVSKVPAVAWRAVAHAEGITIVHQRASTQVVATTTPDGYASQGGVGSSGTCGGGILEGAVTQIVGGVASSSSGMSAAVLPVDVAVSPVNQRVMMISAGAAAGSPNLFQLPSPNDPANGTGCSGATPSTVEGQPVALAYTAGGTLLVQSREPALLVIDGKALELGGDTVLNPGAELFQRDVGTGIACASCHPEGTEDGRVWHFDNGARRTQPLQGGLLGTEPFHWSGDFGNMSTLVGEVMVHRMGGHDPSSTGMLGMSLWLNRIPSLPSSPPDDTAAIARGAELFYSESIGCTSCHEDHRLGGNKSHDVGTGGPMQVPPLLGVASRAPYLHDGCAATLEQRFHGCGAGSAHGNTASLGPAQIDDLIAFLESL